MLSSFSIDWEWFLIFQYVLWRVPSSSSITLYPTAISDGDHSTPRTETTNDPAIKTDSDVSARPEPETGAVETEDGRPRRLAKSTTKPSEYVYFWLSFLFYPFGKNL